MSQMLQFSALIKGAKVEAEDCLQKERDIISNKSILAQMQRADAEARVANITTRFNFNFNFFLGNTLCSTTRSIVGLYSLIQSKLFSTETRVRRKVESRERKGKGLT